MTLSHLGTTVRTGEVCSKVIGQFAFFRMIVQICRNTSRCKQRTRHGGGSPVSISANMAGFVHVVHIAHNGIPPSVCETQKETTSQPTVACASCRFHVGDIAPAIFLLEVDIHYIFPGINITSEGFAQVRALVVDLDVLDRKIG